MDQSTLSKEKVEGEADVGRATADEEMAEVELSAKGLEDFLATGRTGRRNALGDIKDQVAGGLTTADLPLDMAKLSCSENSSNQAGCSSSSTSSPGPGTQAS